MTCFTTTTVHIGSQQQLEKETFNSGFLSRSCVASLSGQMWPFTWWSALLTAPPSGSPPQHCSVFWSRTTSRCSSHSLVWSCPSLAQSSHRHSSNSCCRTHLQVNEWMPACMHIQFVEFHSLKNCNWDCCALSIGVDPIIWEQAKVDNPDPER